MGVFVATFVLTATLGHAYALKQENEQKAIQLQKMVQDSSGSKQAGIVNKNGNVGDQDNKSFQKANNWAKCTFANKC